MPARRTRLGRVKGEIVGLVVVAHRQLHLQIPQQGHGRLVVEEA